MTHSDTQALPGGAYAAQSGAIMDHASDASAYLAIWAMRDDSKPDAAARRAASDAMSAIGAALDQLHALRQRLVSDIRASDDAAMARSAALLAARAGESR